jgi:hypothetical protein
MPVSKTATHGGEVPRGTESDPLFVKRIVAPVSQEDAARDAYEHQEKQMLDRRLTVATELLAGFTFLLFVFTGLMWRATYMLASDTRKAADSTVTLTTGIERAYVKMSHSPDGIVWRDMEFTNTFALEMRIENFGNTPATVTDVLLKPLICAPNEWPTSPNYTRERSIGSFRAFLVSGEHIVYNNPEMLTMSAEDKLSLLTGRKHLFIFGYVDYVDAFGVRHRGGYARRYNPTATGTNLAFVTDAGFNYDRRRNESDGNDWNESLSGSPSLVR